MDDREDDVISVTMSRNAAEKFKAALTFAECRLTPAKWPPGCERDEIAYAHTDWLRWGVGRILNAESPPEPRRRQSAACTCDPPRSVPGAWEAHQPGCPVRESLRAAPARRKEPS